MLHSVDGAEQLLAHLYSRFGGSRLDEKHTAMQELHSCQRGQGTMEDYLTRFGTAIHACNRAGVGLPHELPAHQVLQQANLTHEQAPVVMSTGKADALTRGVVTYREMQAELKLLHGQRAKAWAGTDTVSYISLTAAEHRALVAAVAREPTCAVTPKPSDTSKPQAWHCPEVGHLRRGCPVRVRRHPSSDGAGAAPQKERALLTSCHERLVMVCVSDYLTSQANIDPGATATFASEK